MPKPVLDDLDRKLIALLAEDARISNRAIAETFAVTEGTIRGRIKRLEQAKLIRFTAMTGVEALETLQLVYIYITADPPRAQALAEQIAELPQIHSVLKMLGHHNILAIGLFVDLEDMMAMAGSRIIALEGIHDMETAVAVKTLKFNARMVRISARQRREDQA